MYSQQILDHFHHPRNVGELSNATAVVETTNPVCGDLMRFWVVLQDEKVVDARFKVAGCVAAVACGSWAAEFVVGKRLAELSQISPATIESALGGLPPASRHAAVLAADTLHQLARRGAE